MNIDRVKERLWCHICFKWICAHVGVLLIAIEGQDRSDVLCINCDAHLGYDTDWPELYRQGAETQVRNNPA
jgi:hypothetical protein